MPQLVKESDRVRYRVKSGDYLGRIATKYGVTVSQIKRWNGLRSNNLQVGQRLIIHPNNTVAVVSSNDSNKTRAGSSDSSKIYTVKNGDSLWSISQKFPGVSVDNLKRWNDISGNNLKPGTKLKILKG